MIVICLSFLSLGFIIYCFLGFLLLVTCLFAVVLLRLVCWLYSVLRIGGVSCSVNLIVLLYFLVLSCFAFVEVLLLQ